jgi:ferric-dicitrate binding protein FerR (iron transport regulator)
MKNLQNDKELRFVLQHYKKGLFNPSEAMKKMNRPARQIPLHRWVAVAASLLCLVALAAVVTWQVVKPDTSAKHDTPTVVNKPEVVSQPTAHFHFDDTPLPEVLRQLEEWYDVELTAENASPALKHEEDVNEKHLTGDFSGDSLDAVIEMIEEVLDVEITEVNKGKPSSE